MANKIFGVDFTNETNPTGTMTISVDNGTNLVDVALSDLSKVMPSASSTASGFVELATSSEVDTGTDSTRAIPVDQYVASKRNVRHIVIRAVGATTDWSADGSTTVGGDFRSPITGTITDIWGYSDTAGTTGTAVVDVNKNGTTLMTTNKIKWDSTEKYSKDYSGTLPGLTTTSLSAGDIITVDIDTNHTTKSKGLTVVLSVRES